jgi:lipopolysaccharide exporter
VANNNKFQALREKLENSSLGHGKFGRNVITIIAGTTFAHAIAMAAMPLLARLFSPSDFGLLASYAVVAQILSIIACFGYQNALVLPKRQSSAAMLLIMCLGTIIVVSAATGVIITFFASEISALLGIPELAKWLWLIPFSMIALAGFETFSTWSTRNKDFSGISRATVTRRLVITSSQIGLGTTAAQSSGLIVGQVFGNMAGFLILAHKGLKYLPTGIGQKFRLSRARMLIYRYRQFPGFGLLATLTAALARNLPVVSLGYFFGPAVVGFFAMAYQLVAGPVQIGAASLTPVFFERANRAYNDGDLASLTLTAYQRLTIIVTTPMALLFMASPELIALILGDQWIESGFYLRWITLWLFFIATGSTLHKVFAITERQNELAYLNGLLFIISAMTLAGGGMTGDPHLAVAAFCISSSVVWLLLALRVIHIAGARIRSAIMIMGKEIGMALPFLGIMAIVKFLTPSSLLVTLTFCALLAVFGVSRVRHILSEQRH